MRSRTRTTRQDIGAPTVFIMNDDCDCDDDDDDDDDDDGDGDDDDCDEDHDEYGEYG